MASRFPPRDRSPHRYGDRRPPSHIPSGPRERDDANSVPLGREPPRGPKALIDSRGGHFAPAGPRGRGISSRSDYRDRDPRDLRDGPPPFRRDDRDWPRRDRGFDSRDNRPPFGRRSRSPPPLRDFRDSGPRDLDLPRLRRNSRDGPIGNNLSDLSPIRGGSLRGRGRGDRDRGRGRGFLDDRDLFRRRSLSRDAWRDRDSRFDRDRDRDQRERERERDRDRDRERDRERERDIDRRDRFDRRDDDRRSDRDERDRLPERAERTERPPERPERPERPDRLERSDTWKRDRVPSRIEPKVSSNTATISPSTISPPSSAPQRPAPKDDLTELSPKAPSSAAAVSTKEESKAEQNKISDKQEPPSTLQETSADRPVPQFSLPSAVPEIPAFGSLETSPRQSTPSAPSQASALATTPAKPWAPSVSIPAAVGKAPSDLFVVHNVRPPTCPRADRVESHHGPDFHSRRMSTPDVRTKNEVIVRPTRPPPMSPGVPPAILADRRAITPSASDKSSQASTQLDEKSSLPRQNTGPMSPPTGPAAISSQALGRSPLDLNSSPVAHRRPSTTHTSPRLPFSNIPTGPRALQQRPIAPRSGPKGSNQWVRPGYVSRVPPSVTSGSPTKRDSFTDDRDAVPSTSDDQTLDERKSDGKFESNLSNLPVKDLEREVEQVISEAIAALPPGRPTTPEPKSTEKTPELKEDSMLPMLLAESSGEVSDEDDLDEEDFNQGEQRFEKEMQALAAEIPPSPLEDPSIVALLLKIQLLGIIAEGTVSTSVNESGSALETEKTDGPAASAPSPSKEENDIELPDAPSIQPPADEIPGGEGSSVETLPFLHTGPPTPFSDMESFQDTMKLHDAIKETVRGELLKQRKEIDKYHTDLKEQYRAYYKPWRLSVDALDRKKAEEERKAAVSGPSSPPGPPSSVTSNPILEGRRGYRMNSELDFQNALKASTITAEEEDARRRDREATARPDLSREAPIPDMLDPKEKQASIFRDTNQIVDPSRAFEVFAFDLPPDDFTPEEHKIFTDTFMAHPKKWGKIAEALPGRNFQQCINHYYQTKEDMKYKAKLNKRWARRGRGRKTVARPPRSNALMTDLGVVRPIYDGDEPSEATPALTDTGRPRRAAAPTFGDLAGDTETSTSTPVPGKRNTNASSKEATEQPAEKPARRGGRGGNRGGRRAKQIANPTPIAAAPPKPEPQPEPPSIMENTTENIPPTKREEVERMMPETLAPPVPRAKPGRARGKSKDVPLATIEPTEADLTPRPIEGGYGSQQPTSYWSVPEQRDFPELIAHFGKDFEAISQFMKTKTATMVRNYFQRSVDSGKSELEELAMVAENKKQRGEPLGPLPIPSLPTKRRYDATPSSVGQRPLAPNTDASELAERPLSARVKPPAVPLAAAPPAIQPRQTMDKPQVQQVFYPPVQARGSQISPLSAAEEAQQRVARCQTAQAQQRLPPGPRMGYFSDGRGDGRSASGQVNIAPSHLQEIELKRQQQQQQQPPAQPITGLGPQASMGGMPSQNLGRHMNAPPLPGSDPQDISRYQQLPSSSPFSQPSYLQPRPSAQAGLTPQSHSRRPSRSLSSAAASPVQLAKKIEHPGIVASGEAVNQPKPVFRQPNQFLDINRGPPTNIQQHKDAVLSNTRPSSTPSQATAEPPRQVPAKRSNIMSILNDEPEEPQPRKRFASSDYSAHPSTSRPPSPSRPPYASSSLGMSSHPGRPEDQSNAGTPQYQRPQYVSVGSHQSQAHSAQPSRSQMGSPQAHSDFPGNYGNAQAGGSLNQDWMARFDPRSQVQQSQSSSTTDQHLRLARQQSTSQPYSSGGNIAHSASMSSLQSQQSQSQTSTQHQSQAFAPQALQSSQQQAMQMHGQQGPSTRNSPIISQHLQPFSRPSSPPMQRPSIPFAVKSAHQRPESPMQTQPQSAHQQSSRYSSYTPLPSASRHRMQSVMEDKYHTGHLYQHQHQHQQQSHQHQQQGLQSGSGGGGTPQQYAPTPPTRRVPSLSPRHQNSHLPQHQLAQHELRAQRQHRASFNLGHQADSPLSRGHAPATHPHPPNPPPSQHLNRTASLHLERSYTPPSGLSKHAAAAAAVGPGMGGGGSGGGNAGGHGIYSPSGLMHSQSLHPQHQPAQGQQQQQQQQQQQHQRQHSHTLQQPSHPLHQRSSRHPGDDGHGPSMDQHHHVYERR